MIRRIASIALLCALQLGACSPGTDPGPCTSIECFEDNGFLVVESYRHHLVDTSYLSSAAHAGFMDRIGPYSGFPVLAGRVRLNGVELGVDDYRDYLLADSTVPLRFAPARNIWTVSGSSEIAGFVDTATIPALRPTLLLPRPGDSISISGGLDARWHGLPDDSGTYQLRILHPTDGDDRRTISFRDQPDSASVSYPLAGRNLVPGPVIIDLVHSRTHFIRIGEGVRVASTVVLVERVAVVLVE